MSLSDIFLIVSFSFAVGAFIPLFAEVATLVFDECQRCRTRRKRLGEFRWDLANDRWRTMRLTNKRPPPPPRDDDAEWYDESRVPC